MYNSSLIPFKQQMVKFFILFLLFLTTACDPNSSGGVIVFDDAPNIPVVSGPHDPSIGDAEPINPPSILINPYTSIELQNLIDNTPSGGVLELEKDADLKLSIIISNPITIKEKNGADVKIKVGMLSNFYVQADNVSFSSLDFEIETILNVFESGGGVYQGFNLEKNVFHFNGMNEQFISFEDFSIKNNSFFGACDFCYNSFNLLKIINSKKGDIQGNLFVSLNQVYESLVSLGYSDEINVLDNVFLNYSASNNGVLNIEESSRIIVSGNYINDLNKNKVNDYTKMRVPETHYEYLMDMTGSVSIFIKDDISQVSDLGRSNFSGSQNFDIGFHRSVYFGTLINPSNISLTPIADDEFNQEDLFNNLPSMDLHPLCSGRNPGVSSVSVPGWQSYQLLSGATLYYAGAIQPACL